MLNFLAWKPGKQVIHIDEASYKEEPKEKEEKEECQTDPLGHIGCPVPPEVE